jgi:hypothetical protein
MFANIIVQYKKFQPAAVGSNETKALFSVKKGERVLWATALPEIKAAASTDTSMTLGDGDDADGLITAIDLETMTAGTPISHTNAGAYLAYSGGKIYTADDTIDVVYAGTTYGATNPSVTFMIAKVRDFPGGF